MRFTAGALVRVRNRDWVVMPSADESLVLLKPLGGSEAEIIGIYKPLDFVEDEIVPAEFPQPTIEDLGDITNAQILRDAARLSFRQAAGPFRSLAKLSFRPRAYQMVPLIMALRQQEPVRLLIADDVGVGKTIEALLIVKELLERGEIKRFAVLCLAHLCDQWQQEIKDKFNIDAVIIRSNTKARLDREVRGDMSVFEYYPFQVISIDFIKNKRPEFVQYSPEMIIVDEAHTCTRPTGANKSQQLRHHLVRDLADQQDKHLLLLTATPHSGKPEQFQSLLGLLDKDFEKIDLGQAQEADRKRLARHFVQRRRQDVLRWLGEETPFPKRDAGEIAYEMSMEYAQFYNKLLAFVQQMMQEDNSVKGAKQRLRYWTALALLRGAMSSPWSGIEMLGNRLQKLAGDLEEDELIDSENPVMDSEESAIRDHTQADLVERLDWNDSQKRKLRELRKELDALGNIRQDRKIREAHDTVQQWLKEGYQVVIFCKYIPTARYVGNILQAELPKAVNIQVVTSEDPDEVRRERIEAMAGSSQRLLVATDCLSEGINLQELFTAVLHYDLPWNPNRLEQREGRVDRYGQRAELVKAYLLYGKSNPIDGVVFRVLLQKVREIRRQIGISIPFPENSESILDAVLSAVLLRPMDVRDPQQLSLFQLEEVKTQESKATRAIDEAAEREKLSRSRFAQHTIKASEIAQDLEETDQAIGYPEAVEKLVTQALPRLGVSIQAEKKIQGYYMDRVNLPPSLRDTLPPGDSVRVSFVSPTPEGYLYLGRNHLFIEQLCQYLLAQALDHQVERGPARASVIRTGKVQRRTTLFLLRVRNVIESRKGNKQLVAEEMHTWGYQGSPEDIQALPAQEAESLLQTALPEQELSRQQQEKFLQQELEKANHPTLSKVLNNIAEERAEKLIEAHERFSKAMGGSKRFQLVRPVLPMDLLGIYILLPTV